jgi:hypothetical protein
MNSPHTHRRPAPPSPKNPPTRSSSKTATPTPIRARISAPYGGSDSLQLCVRSGRRRGKGVDRLVGRSAAAPLRKVMAGEGHGWLSIRGCTVSGVRGSSSRSGAGRGSLGPRRGPRRPGCRAASGFCAVGRDRPLGRGGGVGVRACLRRRPLSARRSGRSCTRRLGGAVTGFAARPVITRLLTRLADTPLHPLISGAPGSGAWLGRAGCRRVTDGDRRRCGVARLSQCRSRASCRAGG